METKTCTKCGETKAFGEFYKHSGGRDGLRAKCKCCYSEVASTWVARNRIRRAEITREWSRRNRSRRNEQARVRYAGNKEAHVRRAREWAVRNPDKVAAAVTRRRAVKLQATPAWANHGYINLIYKFAKIEEERTGRKVHVDHIVPLQGENVCGLHCEDNLQLLFAEDNCRKGNSHTP